MNCASSVTSSLATIVSFSSSDLRESTRVIVRSLALPILSHLLAKGPVDRIRFGLLLRDFRVMAERIDAWTTSDNREQTHVKYYLDLMMCKVFESPTPPPRPATLTEREALFAGFVRKYVMRAVARRDATLIYSLQKGSKQSWPAMGSEKQLASLLAHRADWTSTRTSSPAVLASIAEVSRSVFTRRRMGDPTKFLPTGSACLQAPRNKGGALSLTTELQQVTSGPMGRLPSLVHAMNAWRDENFHRLKRQLEVRVATTPETVCQVKVVSLPEPAKFRTITVGDGEMNSVLQPVQGQMIEAWKRDELSTMGLDSDEAWEDRINLIDSSFPRHYEWCSLDMTGATDKVHKDATFAGLHGVDHSPWIGLIRFSFGRFKVVYPKRALDGTKLSIPDGYTDNGQPMGHPLSFPILCVINKGVLRHICRLWVGSPGVDDWERAWRRLYAKRILRLSLINGDDLLFKSDREFYLILQAVWPQVGFIESVGKSYVSSNMCSINSRIFVRKAGRMVQVSYLNQRLIYGTNIKDGTSLNAQPTHVANSLNRMCKFVPWATNTLPLAFQRWPWARELGFTPNWYLPVHLGGYGLDPSLAPDTARVDRLQRLVAAVFINKPQLALARISISQKRTSAFRLTDRRLKRATCQWRLVKATDERHSHEQFLEFSDDPWQQLLCQASRMGHAGVDTIEKTIMFKVRRHLHRWKPMTDAGILDWWDISFVSTPGPIAPRLTAISWDRPEKTLNLLCVSPTCSSTSTRDVVQERRQVTRQGRA